jgi:hypothetical protein
VRKKPTTLSSAAGTSFTSETSHFSSIKGLAADTPRYQMRLYTYAFNLSF